MSIWNKLFCKHKYEVQLKLPCTFEFDDKHSVSVPIHLLECKLCGHRKVLKSSKCFYCKPITDLVNLYQKGQIDIDQIKF